MRWWPFGRRKRKKKRAAPVHHSARAQEAARQMRQQRKKRPTKPKPAYVPPPVPDDPRTLPLRYQAPAGAAVWPWLKRAPPDYFVEGWAEQDPDGYEDFSKWPRAEAPKVARAIRRHVLELILEASRAQYPNEFGGMLRAEKGVIEELVLLPGTVSGDSHAIFQFHMMPVDMSIIGTIHSHPSPVPYPSAADTELFERNGRVHIITGYPFGPGDWRAFDPRSRLIELDIVD